MKTIFILLLGFGGTYPMACSKKQSKPKQESELKEKQTTPAKQKTFTYSLTQNSFTFTNKNTFEIYS